MNETSGKYPECSLIGWGSLLNGIWEFGHSPLYADHATGLIHIVWTRLHCTLGDVLIMLATFWITSLVFQTRRWLVQRYFAFPATVFLGLGVCYTAFSEWFNTRVVGNWSYTENMPTFFGIGLTPLLQWLIIPMLVIAIIRNRRSIGKQ